VATISSCHGGMDPHCIFGGHILSQYFFMDPQCIGQRSCFESSNILSIGMPTLEMEHILIFFDGCLQLLPSSPALHHFIK
jgi:hypothetical protein